jgi:hypothetical protein
MNLLLRAALIVLVGIGASCAYLAFGHYDGLLNPLDTVREIALNTTMLLGALGCMTLWNLGRRKQTGAIASVIAIIFLTNWSASKASFWTYAALVGLGIYVIVAATWLNRQKPRM